MSTPTPPQEQMKDPDPIPLKDLLLNQEDPPALTPDEFTDGFSGFNDPFDEDQTNHRRSYYVYPSGIGNFIHMSDRFRNDGTLGQHLTIKLNEAGIVRGLNLWERTEEANCKTDTEGTPSNNSLQMEKKLCGNIELSDRLAGVQATFSPLGEEYPGLYQFRTERNTREQDIGIEQIIRNFGWSDSEVLTRNEEDVLFLNLPKFFEAVAEFADKMG